MSIGINKLIENMMNLDVKATVADAVDATKTEIVAYQQGQMLRGKDRFGGQIGKYKNPDYARRKANQNPLAGYGNVDLRDKGPFQQNIKVVTFIDSVQIFSTDEKNEDLTEKYGEKIFGLSPEFAGEYAQLYLTPKANSLIKDKIYEL